MQITKYIYGNGSNLSYLLSGTIWDYGGPVITHRAKEFLSEWLTCSPNVWDLSFDMAQKEGK